jgi:S1-C subfamily serine protease
MTLARVASVLGLAGCALFGGTAAEFLFLTRQPIAAQTPLPPPPATIPDDLPRPAGASTLPENFAQIVDQVMPSVVSVDAVKVVLPAGKAKQPAEESGSGVVVRLEPLRGLYVVTNDHVVAGAKANTISVTLNDGRIFQPDRVWSDPESDLAFLRIDGANIPTAELGDSDKARPGQWVLAFGSPFGFNQTVTHGIISARDRGQVFLPNQIRIKEFLQTDAAINPGNSGGPLVDTAGKVIGINTANASSNGTNSGVAFSIPINLVKRVGRQLIETGKVSRGYLGMQLAPVLDPQTAIKLGLTKLRGAVVESLHPNGPAAQAGLRPSDVILKLDDVEIRDENHLINIVSVLPANQKVRLMLWRNKQYAVTTVTVGEWPGR